MDSNGELYASINTACIAATIRIYGAEAQQNFNKYVLKSVYLFLEIISKINI
jgi:hypothetical protein